jgi:hypothetical protein
MFESFCNLDVRIRKTYVSCCPMSYENSDKCHRRLWFLPAFYAWGPHVQTSLWTLDNLKLLFLAFLGPSRRISKCYLTFLSHSFHFQLFTNCNYVLYSVPVLQVDFVEKLVLTHRTKPGYIPENLYFNTHYQKKSFVPHTLHHAVRST